MLTKSLEKNSNAGRRAKAASIFRNPVIWALAVLEGIVGVGYFSSNWFIPGAVEMVFGKKAMTAAYIISTGFIVAICANMFFGYLMDRFNKWNVMALMMVILIPASLCMIRSLPLFWIASSIVLSVGLSAAQQCFSLAAELVTGREMGNVMGVVSLGPGIFGFVGPQMLGWLRDWTGSFTAGWYFLALWLWYRYSSSFTSSTTSISEPQSKPLKNATDSTDFTDFKGVKSVAFWFLQFHLQLNFLQVAGDDKRSFGERLHFLSGPAEQPP